MIENYSRLLLLLGTMFMWGHLSGQTQPIAAGKPKFLGNIYSSGQVSQFLNYWNQVTPENAGKWGSAEPTRDNHNWTELDAAYKLAKDNGLPFKFHVLIWGNQQPSWIESLSTEEQLEEIHEWFDEVANRYPDIDFIEVVNEPLHDPPDGVGNGNYINALGGRNGTEGTGWDWVITAFEMARQYFPNAELMLNDYGIVGNQTAVNNYKKIIELLKDRDLIDQIGVQCHAFTVNDLSAAAITNSLNSLSQLNLPIYVTELDIDGLDDDNLQLTRYQRVFPALWKHPSVYGVTLWGWRPGMWRSAQGATLISNTDKERPALTWLRTYVAETDAEPVVGPVTGIDHYAAEEFRVYPNPSTGGNVTVSGFGRADRVKLVDLNGRVLKEQKVQSLDEQDFDISGLIPGMYAIQVQRGTDVYVTKIVIR